MSQLPFMPMWWGDFFNKTDHLSNEEQWAYAKLMAKTWLRNCKPFPDEPKEIARVLDMGVKRWLKIRERIAPFFDLSEGTWRQEHLEEVFLEYARRASISRSNGARGGRPKTPNIKEIENPAGLLQDKGQLTESKSNIKKDSVAIATEADASPPRDPMKEFWDKAKAVLGASAAGVIGKCRKEYGDAAVMEALIAVENECPSQPIEFFIGCLRYRRETNGRHKPTASENLFLGGLLAADSVAARLGISDETVEPLLEGERGSDLPESPDRRLAGGSGQLPH